MAQHSLTLGILLVLPLAAAVGQDSTAARICLAPTSVQVVTGNANQAIDAVRETFTGFLTGPSLGVKPLTARLESQAREEAKAAACPYVLFTTMKHERKKGSGILGRAVGSAVQHGAWSVAGGTSSTAGRVAATAAAGAASAAAWDFATSVRTKDELTLTYRLEGADGARLIEKTEKRKAESDGEDLLTPLVERAAEAIAAVVTKQPGSD
jgi:hypothetical protein